MSDNGLRRIAWGTALLAVVILVFSSIMLLLAPDFSKLNWLGTLIGGFVALGAPILGIIIVIRQPRHRVGWLWLVYGLLVGLRTLGHAIYYYGGSQPTGYSALEYFLLWSTELANITSVICLILLVLWFPDGQLISRSWRFLYVWLFFAAGVLILGLFSAGTEWNGGANAGGIVIDNPYGWLTADESLPIGFFAFISIVLIMILAVISLVIRYRLAGQLERLQLRWFVFGGVMLLSLDFIPALFIDATQLVWGFKLLLYVLLNFAAIIPLYLAVGIAILRYRLYDIDLIIRRTLQYSLLTGLLVVVYFGSVILLQSIVEYITGQQSPIVIVISTLIIAALFNPLRIRIQDFMDRRFYRQRYDAQKALAGFAATARDEVDMEKLTSTLLGVVVETIQPEQVELWLTTGEMQ